MRRELNPTTTFAVLSALAGAWILYLTRGMTFYWDEWWVVTGRMDWDADALLRPYNNHLSALPVLAFKLVLEVTGLGGYWLLLVLNTALVVGCAWLVFIYGRERIGGWAALFAACPFLVLGTSFMNILWAGSLGFLGALTAFVGALVALDRERPRLACLALTLGVMCSGIGLAGVVGVLVDQRKRVWVAGVPLAGWLLWTHFYPAGAATQAGLLNTPTWIVGSTGHGAHALLGWSPTFGFALVVCLLVAGRWNWRALALLAAPLALWTMLALARTGNAAPSETRYLYPNALLITLLGIELWRERVGTRTTYVLIAACTLGIAFNAALLAQQAEVRRWVTHDQWKHVATDPGFPPDFTNSYQRAVERYGD